MTEVDGVTATFTYDALGRQTFADYGHGITLAHGYGAGPDWTTLDAPTLGHLERRWTPTGRLGGWVLPDGGAVTYLQDGAGRLLEEVDPLGRRTRFTYDEAGQLIHLTDATGATEMRAYDPRGDLVRQTDALGQTTHYTYTPDGRLATLTDAHGSTWTTRYTPTTVTVADPLGRETTTIASPYSLPLTLLHPDGTRQETRYLLTSPLQDAQAYPTSQTDENGRVRTFTYTATGQLATATDRGGSVYHYHYDKAALSSIVDPRGETRSFTYDALENLTATTFPDGTAQHTTYGAHNLPEIVTRPSGITVTVSYDTAGRPVAHRSSRGEEVQFTWDAAGTLTTVQDSTGTTQYHYDARGGFAGLDTPDGARLRYTRDATGRLIAIAGHATPTATALVTQYTYDAVGNVTTVRDPLGGNTRLTYDAANRLVRRVLPNGVTTTFTYDARDRLTRVIHQAADGTVLASATYTRLATGEPTQIVWEDGAVVQLTYDAALRLTAETYIAAAGTVEEQRTYTYDAAGNRLTRTTAAGLERFVYGPGATLRYIEGPGGVMAYDTDPDGRVISMGQAVPASRLAYTTTDQLSQSWSPQACRVSPMWWMGRVARPASRMPPGRATSWSAQRP